MAILLGALLIHNIKVGPLLIKDNPDLFWGVLGSMYVGNVMLLILNVPLIGMWVRILKIPYPVLFPLILLFCLIGVYSVNNNIYEVIIMILFGIVGYLMKKFAYEGAPLILAFVLSPLLENALRQSLIMSGGDFSIFFTRPISLFLIAVAIFLLVVPLIPGSEKAQRGRFGLALRRFSFLQGLLMEFNLGGCFPRISGKEDVSNENRNTKGKTNQCPPGFGGSCFFPGRATFVSELDCRKTLSQPVHQHDRILCPGIGYGPGQQGYGG